MNITTFDLDKLVVELKAAALGGNANVDVATILKNALRTPDQVRSCMPEFENNDTILHEDSSVSIWHCRFEPGYEVPAHDHQMSAAIGIYSGSENNKIYTRLDNGTLTLEKEIRLQPGDVLQIQPDEIHAVSCASEVACCGIHVYLGRLTTVERSLFDIANSETLEFTDENYRRLTKSIQVSK